MSGDQQQTERAVKSEVGDPRMMQLEEKIAFMEREMEVFRSSLDDLYGQVNSMMHEVERKHSGLLDRIASLVGTEGATGTAGSGGDGGSRGGADAGVEGDDAPPPHWGRARAE